MTALLITATDTNAGKTVLTMALAAYCQTYLPAEYWGLMKPLQSGTGDQELYQKILRLNQSPEEITPLYYTAPLAPPLAARREGKRVEWEKVWPAFVKLQAKRDLILIESLGGLGSPITLEMTVADWARDWRLPTVLVVPVKLGSIGQAVANVALARSNNVNLVGIVLNCRDNCTEQEIDDWASLDLIQSLTQIPILGLIPYLENPTDLGKLAQVASGLDLEKLIKMPSRLTVHHKQIIQA